MQNLQQLKILRIFGSITSTYHKSHFVLQISWLPKIVQKWFCIQNLRMDLSFQEKKTVCKSVTWFTSYANSRIQENSCVFIEMPCMLFQILTNKIKINGTHWYLPVSYLKIHNTIIIILSNSLKPLKSEDCIIQIGKVT